MKTHANEQASRQSDATAATAHKASAPRGALGLAEPPPGLAYGEALQSSADRSPRRQRLATIQAMASASPRVRDRDRHLQALFASTGDASGAQAAQRRATGSAGNAEPVEQTGARTGGHGTGLPEALKNGIEALSGLSMDHVKVHYDSARPAQLQAHAYAQGDDIHLAPGQERHLPHEAWHVVQQARGRVQPTGRMHGGVNVNDDAALEKEADDMGAKALQQATRTRSTAPMHGARAPVTQRRPWAPPAAAGLVGAAAAVPDVLVQGQPFQSTAFQHVLPASASKTAALVDAAAYIGGLGIPAKDRFHAQNFLNSLNVTQSIAGTLANSPAPADWAPRSPQHWATYRNNIDPFLVQVTTSYPAAAAAVPGAAAPPHQVILTYEFGKASYGYVVRIQQNGGDFTMNPQRGQNVALGQNEYASAHATAPGANDVSALANAATDEAGISAATRNERLDAVTKIAGEAPRWQCIRTLAAANNLRNDSRIHTPDPAGHHYYVTFATLWGSWDSAFGSAFNIADATVQAALLNGATRWNGGARVQAPAGTAWNATDVAV